MNDRWLLTSRYFPPRPGGASTTYTNLLRHLDQDRVYVLTSSAGASVRDPSGLQCHVEAVRPLVPAWVKGQDRLSSLDILPVARRGIRLVRRHGLARLLATVPDVPFLVASYFIHRATGVPLYLYLHDTILEAQRRLVDKNLARLFQRRILQSATKVFVLTPGLQEFYRRKYAIESILLPHCLDEALLVQQEGDAGPDVSGEPFAVFSGAVYWLNADALRLFAEAVHRVPGLHFQIASFTSPRAVEEYGIIGPHVKVSFLKDHQDVIALQRKARFLYLPLTFDRANADEVDSAFPTKIIEYLVARTPILVHAPPRKPSCPVLPE